MRIALATPPQAAAGGNTATALRWRRILGALGHTVVDAGTPDADDAELLVALHARKSAAAIRAFTGPVVVAATGTDLYHDLAVETDGLALDGFRRAWRIATLHPGAADALPPELRAKARTVLQSVPALDGVAKDPPYTVSLVAHLRAVKDPLVAGQAAIGLPHGSRIRVVHAGAALEPSLGDEARALASRSHGRYQWLGPLPADAALRQIAASHLLVVPSRIEGGANVVGEALAHGVPVAATRIPGNVGLLGADWPALFEVGDADGLRDLLARWEADPVLQATLAERANALRPRFAPEAERRAWAALLAERDGPAG